ncbi:MAG: FG-GAP repeat protein, partial [Myxococcota bacterium]
MIRSSLLSVSLWGLSAALTGLGCDAFSVDSPAEPDTPVPSTSRVFPDGDAELLSFGSAVALAGETLVVGASGDDRGGLDAGAVHWFTRVGDGWMYQAALSPDDSLAGDRFGAAVALSADGATLLVGAPGRDLDSDDRIRRDVGAVYEFSRGAEQWTQSAVLLASDLADGDEFDEDEFG